MFRPLKSLLRQTEGMEMLESRQLLSASPSTLLAPAGATPTAGTVRGTLFNDTNGNGTFDAGESPTGVRTVYLDANANGTLDSGETSVQSDASGNYVFNSLDPGTYNVSRVFPDGYHLSNASAGTNGHDVVVTVAAGSTATADIGTHEDGPVTPPPASTGSVSGMVFNDLNGNGVKETGETGLPNVDVRLYYSGTDSAVTIQTDASGNYSFSNLAPGGYYVAETTLPGYIQTTPSTQGTPGGLGAITIFLNEGQNVTDEPFGQFKTPVPPTGTGTLTGTLWNDTNGNGQFDGGEVATGARTVFIDANGNGQLDTGERSTQSDAGGKYIFTGVSLGQVNVTRVFPAGYHLSNASAGTNGHDVVVTVAAGSTSTADLGTHEDGPVTPPATTGIISGMVFNDANGNGIKDNGETGLPNVTVLAHLDGTINTQTALTDASGNYSFSNLAPGNYYVAEIPLPGHTQTTPITPATHGAYFVALSAGQSVTDEQFGQYQTPVTPPPPPINGAISGTLWNDTDGDGQLDHGEVGTGARQVFIDTNGNGQLDAGEVSTMSDGEGRYTFINIAPGTYNVTRVFPAGYHLSNASPGTGGHDVIVAVASGATANVNLGTHEGDVTPPPPSTGSISGVLWNDTDADGQLDHGEVGTGVRQVFIDTNGNGQLDTGEISTMSDATGLYAFDDLAAGSYKISRTFPAGYHLSNASAGTGGHDVIALVTGGSVTNTDIGTHETVFA